MRYVIVLSALASTALGRRHHHHWPHHGNGSVSYHLTTGTGGCASTGVVGPLSTFLPVTVTTFSTVTFLETSTVKAGELPGSASGPVLGGCSAGTVFFTYTPTVTVTAGQESASATLAPISSPAQSTTAVSSPALSSSAPASTSTSASSSVVVSLPDPSSSTLIVIPSSTTVAAATTSSEASATTTLVESPATSTLVSTTETPASTAAPASTTVAAETTSTASASSVPSPSGTPQLSSKRGILATAGQDQEALTVAFTKSPKISWLCNWYHAPPPNEDAHIQYVPQLYGTGDAADNYKGWNINAQQAIDKDEKYFLSFGEPAATMTPQQAVDLFMQEMQPYAKQGVAIGSPSVLQPRPEMDWLAEFLPLCEQAGCSISFIAVHWFDHTTADKPGFPEFKGAVENATALANGKPVWVDNFQANGTEPDVKAFFDEAIPYLEANDAVARYAYVSPMRTEPAAGFLNQDGSLSDLGAYYANYAS